MPRGGDDDLLEDIDVPYSDSEILLLAERVLDINDVSAGDRIAINVTHPTHTPLVEAIALEAATRRAAFEVVLPESDREYAKQAVRLVEDGALILTPGGHRIAPLDPQMTAIYEKLFPEFVASSPVSTTTVYKQARAWDKIRRTGILWPTREWADLVYQEEISRAEMTSDEAYLRLGQDLLYLQRAREEDSLRDHLDELQRRAEALNAADIESIVISTPGGTELSLDLLPDHEFVSCRRKTSRGSNLINMATEEIFTTPDWSSAQGHIITTMPLSLPSQKGPVIIDKIYAEIRGGLVTDIYSLGKRPEQETRLLRRLFLQHKLLSPAERRTLSAPTELDRVAEIGLVDPASSRVSTLERSYYNTMIDENFASHLGLGIPYDTRRDRSRPKNIGERGTRHIDLSIGNKQTTVDLVLSGGRRHGLVRGGRWHDLPIETLQGP